MHGFMMQMVFPFTQFWRLDDGRERAAPFVPVSAREGDG